MTVLKYKRGRPRVTRIIIVRKTSLLAACTLSAAFAHYTWVVPAAMPFVVGKSVKIMVAHGDRFPHTDEAVNAAQSEAQSALNQDQVPRAYQGAVKSYFDDLKE